MKTLMTGVAAAAMVALFGVAEPAKAHSGFGLSFGGPHFSFSLGGHRHYPYPYYHRAYYNYPWWYSHPRYRYRYWRD